VRYAIIAIACVVLALASGFDPLLVPAVVGGLLLGLLVRPLWSKRSRLPRFLQNPVSLIAIATALAAVLGVYVGLTAQRDAAPGSLVPP
jgi:hypothetical protein